MNTHEPARRRVAQGYLLLFALLAAGILAAGYFFQRHYAEHFRTKVQEQLVAIGETKVGELVQFRRERLVDASVLFKNAAFARVVQHALATPPDPEAQGQLQRWLGQYVAPLQYDRAFLLDAQGTERIAIPASAPAAPAAAPPPGVAEALRSGRIVFQDFYRDERDQKVSLALLVPIRDETAPGRVLGVVGLRIDPAEFLFPMINRFPLPGTTFEVKLIRRDGDAALYLNEFRAPKRELLTARVPLTETRRLPVMAVLGQTGIMKGVNRHGNRVVGYARAVPDSPWFVALYLDTEEAYAPVREQRWLMIALVAALVVGSGAGLGLIWRTQRLRFYREKAAVAEALRASERRFKELFDDAPVGYHELDATGKIVRVNATELKLLGYSAEEMLGQPVWKFVGDAESARQAVQAKLSGQHSPAAAFERSYRRKDGTTVPVLVEVTLLRSPEGKVLGLRSTLQNITERKQAEAALRHSEASLQAILRSTADGLLAVGIDNRVLLANGRFAEMWRIPPELLAAGDDTALLQHVLGQLVDPPGFLRKIQELKMSEEETFDILHFKDGRVFDRLSRPLLEEGKLRGRVWSFRDVTKQRQAEEERERLISELRQTLAEVKTLGGLLPICAGCKKIRDDTGYWNQVEVYIRKHTGAKFTHGMCPECIKKYYPFMDET